MPLNLLGTTREQTQLADLLVASGIFSFTYGRIFTFSNGIKSPGVYGDCRKALSNPEIRDRIIDRYVRLLSIDFSRYEGIAGVETAGIGYGAIVAYQTKLPYIGVRKAPKGYGDESWFAGDRSLIFGRRVAVVEDMTTTGGSLFKAVDILTREASCKVSEALTVFSYRFPEVMSGADSRGVTISTLCTFEQIFERALERRLLSESYEGIVRSWRKNPHDESWITSEWS